MKTSENINEIAKAMSLAQKEMKPALLDATNPFFKSKYSNMLSVWETVREPLTNHSLTVWQDVQTLEKSVSVTTRVVHSSGQWVEFGPFCIPFSKLDAHSIGSATTYAKRYSFCAALGIVSDEPDDDANNASTGEKIKDKQSKTVTRPIEIKNDINHPDVQTFLSKVTNKEDFIKYMYATMKSYNWENEVQAIKEFSNNIEITKQAFEDWVKNKT